MRALVILPTYNEADNVLPLSREILDIAPETEILVVDDDSPDGTGDHVEAAGRTEPRLHLLRRPGKLGLGSAYLAGFRHGLDRNYDVILTMDCDGSHHPRHLRAGGRYPGRWIRRRRPAGLVGVEASCPL